LVVPVGAVSADVAVAAGSCRSALAVSVLVVPDGTKDAGVPVAPTWAWRSIVKPCTPDPERREEQLAATLV
jgi:hypothetical protein